LELEKTAKAEDPMNGDNSLSKVSLLEDMICNKDKLIEELKAKCQGQEEQLKQRLEKSRDSIDRERQEEESQGENYFQLVDRLKQQQEMIEVLQWSFFILDIKLTKQSDKVAAKMGSAEVLWF